MFSLLNLFRHYNDLLMSNSDRSMSLNHRNLLAYFSYLKSRHPIMKTLMTLINLIKIVQIPLEMIVAKVAKSKRAVVVLVIELSKFIIKFGIWQGSGWRPVPKQLSISPERRDNTLKPAINNINREVDERVKEMEDKMDQLSFELKTAQSKEPLKAYLIGHKSNIFTSQPSLILTPCADWKSWTRELAHLARPAIYAISLLAISTSTSANKNTKRAAWIPFLISLSLDLYSKWPELHVSSNTNPSASVATPPSTIESEEKARRLLDYLYYPLRSPLYPSFTSEFLDSLEERIGSLLILSPVVDTIKIYRKLCENVYFYTSAS